MSESTLLEVAQIRVFNWKLNKIGRLESNLSQFLFTESAETAHYRPAMPAVVSTSPCVCSI